MRITLEQAAVHISARVALVGVHHHILHVALRVPGGLPLGAGGKTAAAASAQVGRLDFVQDLLRRHLEERLGKRRVAATDDVGVDVLRVDEAVQAEDEGSLVPVEGNIVFMDDPPAIAVLV